MFNVRIGHGAGMHVVAASAVIGFPRAHRANDRHMVHLLGKQGHMLSDLGITGRCNGPERTTGWCTRFQVPDINGCRTTTHPEQDG